MLAIVLPVAQFVIHDAGQHPYALEWIARHRLIEVVLHVQCAHHIVCSFLFVFHSSMGKLCAKVWGSKALRVVCLNTTIKRNKQAGKIPRFPSLQPSC
jgi:hypothetical protein